MNKVHPNTTEDSFYVVAQEMGTTGIPLPAWASHQNDPIGLTLNLRQSATRKEIPEVPGAFQLLNVLSKEECIRIINTTEELGYQEDAAVSLPRKVRHNHNLVWITDEVTDGEIWRRSQHLFEDKLGLYGGAKPLGINPRFRLYRYG